MSFRRSHTQHGPDFTLRMETTRRGDGGAWPRSWQDGSSPVTRHRWSGSSQRQTTSCGARGAGRVRERVTSPTYTIVPAITVISGRCAPRSSIGSRAVAGGVGTSSRTFDYVRDAFSSSGPESGLRRAAGRASRSFLPFSLASLLEPISASPFSDSGRRMRRLRSTPATEVLVQARSSTTARVLGERFSRARRTLLEDVDGLLRHGGPHPRDLDRSAIGWAGELHRSAQCGPRPPPFLALSLDLLGSGFRLIDALSAGAPVHTDLP